MTIRRIVPDLQSSDLDKSVRFYQDLFKVETVMDQGWIATLADKESNLQISVMTHDDNAPVTPAVSIEVDDVDQVYDSAIKAGAKIVYGPTDEPWGLRRFFLEDPDGNVINVLSHLS